MIQALERQRQEDQAREASLGYICNKILSKGKKARKEGRKEGTNEGMKE
jgi:hypothetical protein